jgi:hypothetical protein
MIELILVACLLRQPEHCEQHYLPTGTETSLMACMLTGQLQVVQWYRDHPGWVIRRWTCDMPKA